MNQTESSSRISRYAGYLLPIILCSAAIGAVALTLRGWLPPLASRHGAGVDRLNIYLLISTGAIMAVGHFILAYFIWRFSRAEKVTLRTPSLQKQRFWAILPVIIIGTVAEGGVLVMGMPVFSEMYGAPPSDAFVAEVTAEQFGWNIRYPGKDGQFGKTDPKLIAPDNKIGLDKKDPAALDDIVMLGQLYLPKDKPIVLKLRSKDVIHSFFLPYQRVKQDAVPGLTIETRLVPTVAGDFEIACTELCGMGHFQMRGQLHVKDAADFDKWMSEQKPLLQPSTAQ